MAAWGAYTEVARQKAVGRGRKVAAPPPNFPLVSSLRRNLGQDPTPPWSDPVPPRANLVPPRTMDLVGVERQQYYLETDEVWGWRRRRHQEADAGNGKGLPCG